MEPFLPGRVEDGLVLFLFPSVFLLFETFVVSFLPLPARTEQNISFDLPPHHSTGLAQKVNLCGWPGAVPGALTPDRYTEVTLAAFAGFAVHAHFCTCRI